MLNAADFEIQTERSPYQYRGMFHALGTVFREEGFRALYKGWLPSVIGVVSLSLFSSQQQFNILWSGMIKMTLLYVMYTAFIVTNGLI